MPPDPTPTPGSPAASATAQPLSADALQLLERWWRTANYLSVGQIYLLDNPLLREPLRPEHIKPRLLGHWGTTPGLNFIYAHVNRAIVARTERDLCHRSRPRRSGAGREHIPRRDLQRGSGWWRLCARRAERRCDSGRQEESGRCSPGHAPVSLLKPWREARSTIPRAA
jgi:XFP N-terminal domain